MMHLFILKYMVKQSYDTDDTIFALATGSLTSPLAVIRISGNQTIELLAHLFSRPKALLEGKSHTLVHGFIVDPTSGERVDEVLISLFKDGRGYTGEESVEISCHGSQIAISSIFALLKRSGFREASAGEFTYRAFMNGRMDLTQAEAVHEIISSQSSKAHHLALNRLQGSLYDLIESIKIRVLSVLGEVEIQLDYAEDDIIDDVHFPQSEVEAIVEQLSALIATYSVGRLYSDGAVVVLAGATNVGKSTLFNLLLKQERSIVTDIHGTTRDFIESKGEIEGIPITFYDTAGLRLSDDVVEQEGIKRTYQLLDRADVIVLLFDGSVHDETTLKEYHQFLDDKRVIVVTNKSDIATKEPIKGSIVLSAKKGEGFIQLQKAMIKRLTSHLPTYDEGALIIESQRQKEELERAQEALKQALYLHKENFALDAVAVELQEALHALGALTGEVSSVEMLTHMFSQFCVGK